MTIMNNQLIYKGNIHWWVLLILWGFYARMLYACIYQSGNKVALIIFGIIWISITALLLANRFITIDDEFVEFKYYLDTVKIHVTKIKDVSVVKMSFKIFSKNCEYRDFTGKTLKIETKNGRVYQIAIKNAQKIKDEIERRMLIHNLKNGNTSHTAKNI